MTPAAELPKKVEFGPHMSMEIELSPCAHRRMGELVLGGSPMVAPQTENQWPCIPYVHAIKRKRNYYYENKTKHIKTLHDLEGWAR